MPPKSIPVTGGNVARAPRTPKPDQTKLIWLGLSLSVLGLLLSIIAALALILFGGTLGAHGSEPLIITVMLSSIPTTIGAVILTYTTRR